MKRTYFGILATLASVLSLVSCINDSIVDSDFRPITSRTIAFGAELAFPEDVTRAEDAPNRLGNHILKSEDSDLTLPVGVYQSNGINPDVATRGSVVSSKDGITEFNVWATFHKSDSESMSYFENIAYEPTAGVFNPVNPADEYYWPGSGEMTFVAVANKPDGFTANMNSAGTALESFTYIVDADATKQPDVMLAKNKVSGATNGSVSLTFDHVMSAVNVKIGSVVEGEIRSITFKNVYNKGEYLIEQGVWVVDKTSVGDFTVKMEGGKFVSTGTNASGTPVNTDDAVFMMIPQNPGDNAEMVIEFYDSATGHLYSDGEGAYKPALRGSIAGDNWDKRKTTNYMLSIDESFTLTIEPVGKKLDAHYIIGYANVTVEGIDNWTITATTSDGSEVTIQPEEEVNPLAKQGFWTDKVVDAKGTITTESARGSSLWSGKGNVTNKLFYIFIPENISGKDREISLVLKGTGSSSATTTKVLLQKYPNWTVGGFGWEVVDDAEQGKYGFKWTRKVAYAHKYGWTPPLFGGNGIGSNYNRKTAGEFAQSLIDQYNASNYVSYSYYSHSTTNQRMYIFIDYTKLNNLSGSSDSEKGFENTKALYNAGGNAATMAFETAVATALKTKGDLSDPLAFRKSNSKSSDEGENQLPSKGVPDEEGSLDDLSGILTYILKKNRYHMMITNDGETTVYNPVFDISDLKWYLPAYGQFQYFTPDPNIAGDDKANYWSSTAVDGASEAYIGDGTAKDRDLQYRVIAVRRDENGYGNATATVDNTSMAGGENGEAQWAN